MFLRKKNIYIKLDKLVVANFHDLIKSYQDRKTLCLLAHPAKHAWSLSFLVISSPDSTL